MGPPVTTIIFLFCSFLCLSGFFQLRPERRSTDNKRIVLSCHLRSAVNLRTVSFRRPKSTAVFETEAAQFQTLMDPKSGYCSETGTFHSLRPPVNLPPATAPLSAASYALSIQSTSSWSVQTSALINSATGDRLSYSDFHNKVRTLSASLQTIIGLKRSSTAFILSPTSINIPILYFSLLSIGVVISPANPVSTPSEISRQIKLSKPVIAFATSETCNKLPKLRYRTILIDSPEFESMMTCSVSQLSIAEVSQSDVAAIMYSSGTTGQVKGVMLTHRNLIAIVAEYFAVRPLWTSQARLLYTVRYFHIFGLFYCLKSVALSETVVLMPKFDFKNMLRAVEEFRVTNIAVAPPVVVAMLKGDVTDGYDLSSLEAVGSGGAPLGKDVIKAFKDKFPSVCLFQVSR